MIIYVLITIAVVFGVAWNRAVLSLIPPKRIPVDGWFNFDSSSYQISNYTAVEDIPAYHPVVLTADGGVRRLRDE